MNRAATLGRFRWAHALFVSGVLGALAFACNSGPLAPRPGRVELTALARVPVPGGHVNAAGGNYFHERLDLALDTRLGPFALGAVYNSAWGWTFSVDVTYANGTLRDATGASLPLGALPDGAPAPGTHWVKLDATRVKTKGGLVHAFDAATGRLLAVHWASAAYPRLRFTQTQIAGAWRTRTVEQCTTASACTPVLALAYDASARLVRADDRAGRSAQYGWDGAGRLAFARGGLDVANGWAGERYAYANGFLASIVSSEDERIEIACDAQGRALTVRGVGEGDPTWRFAYGAPDAAGAHPTIATDPLGHATRYAIDASLRVLAIVNPLGERTSFGWAGLRPSSRTDASGARTVWTWRDDDVASETLPSGNVRVFAYAPDGVERDQPLARPLREVRDSLGLVERRDYDANGRLVAWTNGAGETTSFRYGADESLAAVIAPDGQETRFSGVGEHGKPAFAAYGTSLDARVTSFDAVGNPLRSTAPDPDSGGVKQRGYDAARNLATLEVLDATAGGAPTLTTISLSHRSDGQLAQVTRPYGGATTFHYDALGRLVAIAEQSSPGATPEPGALSVTTIARDALGRAIAVERANGMREEVVYDAAGRVVRRRALLRGVVESDVAFVWASGRLVRATDASGFDEAVAYDAAGRVAAITHSLGEVTRIAYDVRSRPVQTELALAGGTPLALLSHAYDLADRELALGYFGASLLARELVAGRLERIHYGNGVREDRFRSTQAGRAVGRELWRGGTRLEKSDHTIAAWPGGEITALRSEVKNSGAADGVTREDYAYATLYAQNAMERRVASSLAGGAEAIRYDALSNLVASASPHLAAAVSYNAEHTRALGAQHPPAAGGLPIALASELAYDAAGFATRETLRIGAQVVSHNDLAWNARGQLAEIRSDGATAASFVYDALGRRLARTLGGTTLRWRFGGAVEADASGQPVAIDLGAVRIALSGAHRFRHDDLRGNPKHVTDAAGRLVRHNAYHAYGQSGALGGASDDHGFAGGTPIATLAASYVLIGARLYAPRLARFLAPDPVWNPVNAYAYTLGNPVDFSDPAGLHAGSHADLARAGLGLVGGLIALTGAVVLFAAAPVGVPTILAAVTVASATVHLIGAIVEFSEQSALHAEATRAEAAGSAEAPSGGGWLGGDGAAPSGGAGGERSVVCSDDGSGPYCTRGSSSGWTDSPRFWLY